MTAERYRGKSGAQVILISTPGAPGGLMQTIEQDPNSIYFKIRLDWKYGKTQFYFWLPGEYEQHLRVGTELSARVDDSIYSWKYNGTQFNYSGEGTDTNSDDSYIDCCGENDYLFAVPYEEPIGKRIDMCIEQPSMINPVCHISVIDEYRIAEINLDYADLGIKKFATAH